MKNKIKPVPKFRNEQDEREFGPRMTQTTSIFPSRAGSKSNLTVASKLR